MTEDNNRFEIKDASEFPSMDVALSEIRKSYEIERSRKSNIEVKISGIIGINAILIAMVSAVGTAGFITNIVVLAPAFISTILGLWTLKSREYLKPGPEPDEIFAYARRDGVNSRKDVIQNYRKAIKKNHETNNSRMETLTKCFWLTGVAFLLVIGLPLVDVLIEMVLDIL